MIYEYIFWSGDKMFYDIKTVYECLMQQLAFDTDAKDIIGYDHVGKHNAAFLQYIGKKDKFGKKIYASDIIKVNRKDSLPSFNTGIVFYWDEQGKYELKSIKKIKNKKLFGGLPVGVFEDNSITINFLYWDDIEKIGNFYENPELLEDK